MRFRLILSIMNMKILQRIKDNYGNNIFIEIEKKKLLGRIRKNILLI